jgi:hypothetical protein
MQSKMGLAVHVQTSFGVVSLMAKGLVLQFIDFPGFPFPFILLFTLISYDNVFAFGKFFSQSTCSWWMTCAGV